MFTVIVKTQQELINMKLILVISTLAVVQAGVLKENCEGINVNGVVHEEEVLYENLDRPFLLAVDTSTNDLYFSYSIKDSEDDSTSAILNLDTKELTNIEDVDNGFAQAVDPVTHNVYIGGFDGLYQYDKSTKKTHLIGQSGVNIWTVFFKDVLYFSTFPSNFLYTFSEGVASRFEDLDDVRVDNFIIDNDDDMFFTNATGLFRQKMGTRDAVLYETFETFGVRGLALDENGKAYACFHNGIYFLDKAEVGLRKVVTVDDAFGITFDRYNNLIYSDAKRLVRLKPIQGC